MNGTEPTLFAVHLLRLSVSGAGVRASGEAARDVLFLPQEQEFPPGLRGRN